MATAKKLPSGNYRVYKFIKKDENGKNIYKSFTAPTKKEAELMALNYVDMLNSDLTFGQALEQYIVDKSEVLSPTTIRGYRGMRQMFESINNVNLSELDANTVQVFINEISRNHSAKTVKNAHGLISGILKHNGINLYLNTKMPSKVKIKYSMPTENEFRLLLDYTKEHNHELYKAICLGVFGMMRRGEISALTAEDVNNNVIHISKDMVLDEDCQWICKNPKTYASDRFVVMPQEVIDILPKEGKLVELNPQCITDQFRRCVRKLNITYFRFHDCRHYGASLLHALGIPDQYIMEQGGWSTDHTLKNVYRNTISDYSQLYAKKATNEFSKMI